MSSIKLYFGLPRSGKTTCLIYLALHAVKSGRYRNVYANIHCTVPGVTYIDTECLGVYDMDDSIVFIDELLLHFDGRDWKQLPPEVKSLLSMYGHHRMDIVFFSQLANAGDARIRGLTEHVYWVYKGLFFGRWYSKYTKVPYGIMFPDPKRSGGSELGEIVQGYRKPPLPNRIFAMRLFRKKYYKYFDSWECEKFPPLPSKYIMNDIPEKLQKSILRKKKRHGTPLNSAELGANDSLNHCERSSSDCSIRV